MVMLERARTSGMPPYTSYRTFKTFIEDFHDHGVPSRIDRSVLTRFSGIVGTQLMHPLRGAGPVEDYGPPPGPFTRLVKARPPSQWPETLLETLRDEYAPMFA